MPDASVVVARPAHATQLVLLFHGVGSTASHLVPLGEAIAQGLPRAMVVSIDGPHASTLGSGREWFSVLGVTEQNRPERIAKAMPLFVDAVARWQQATGLGPEATVLVGFSQGAIMALESTQLDPACVPASRVVALAGRFAEAVRRAPANLRFHFIHGEQDGVVPAQHSIAGADALRRLGAPVTLDLLPGLAHGIDARALQRVLAHLADDRP